MDVGHVGRGVATRSSRVLARAALALVGIDAVEIHHDKANVASARVPAKLGFTFLGEVADERTAPAELGIDCGWRATSAWLDDERSKTP